MKEFFNENCQEELVSEQPKPTTSSSSRSKLISVAALMIVGSLMFAGFSWSLSLCLRLSWTVNEFVFGVDSWPFNKSAKVVAILLFAIGWMSFSAFIEKSLTIICATFTRGKVAAYLLLVASGVAYAEGPSRELEEQEEKAFKQAATQVAASLVRIETVGGLDQVQKFAVGNGPTTGLVLSADGYVISSSFNFISKPASIIVSLTDGRRLAAKVVANDTSRMLTLLKIDGSGLVPAQPAPKGAIKVGQWAIAVGRALDANAPNVSVGIVSAVNRVWGKAIQTDAKVSPVNYGGALVDVDGRVLGVLVPLSPMDNSPVAGVEWYDSGIGFAIPLEDVLATLDRLKQGKDIRQGLAGFSFASQDLYEQEPKIDRVRYDSPIYQAESRTEMSSSS